MTEQTTNNFAQLDFDPVVGVATVTLKMDGRANKINADFATTVVQALDWVRAREGLKGLIIASGHKDFCVGADLDVLYAERSPGDLLGRLAELNAVYRGIETLGVPVVAALTGSALGGGYELALSCHYRVALRDPRIQFGLPEVSLGVIPGAGGTQRLPRIIGIQAGLEHIVQGKVVRAPKALKAGLVDALADDRSALFDAARAWIAANPRARQPWDAGKPIPGPQPNSDEARNMFMAGSAMLRKKTAGVYRAPELAISAVQEGIALAFERGVEIESRYFAHVATSDQAKDMLRTIWFHRTAAERHEDLPVTQDDGIRKVGIVGAGMMGAGLAFISAKAGAQVVLKDVDADALTRGVKHIEAEAAKLRHLSAAEQQTIVARIKPSLELPDLADCDLIIEAVFENLELKHKVTQEAEPQLAAGGIWASNTSAIPIGDLAKVSKDPAAFIGLHFFSPVEKMQLVEIITAEHTSEQTLARALAFTKRINKLPIVVGDGYGFYTTRVFSAYILEGAQLVAEGHDPVLIEWAARRSGMVVPPLQVFDEVSLGLVVKGFAQGRHYGRTLDIPGVNLVETMVNKLDRPGKAQGRGFYEYKDGRRSGLWAGLADLSVGTPKTSDAELLGQRLLAIQAVEAARCVDAGIVKQTRDAEVGAIFGIGFAPNTGGPLSYIDRQGIAGFVETLDRFTQAYGQRYAAPDLLRSMAAGGKRFFDDV